MLRLLSRGRAFTNVQNVARVNAFNERSERCAIAVHDSSVSQDPLLPAYLYDRLYKILISGYYVGPTNQDVRILQLACVRHVVFLKLFHTSFCTVQEPSNMTQAHSNCGPPYLSGGINEQDRIFTPLIGYYY